MAYNPDKIKKIVLLGVRGDNLSLSIDFDVGTWDVLWPDSTYRILLLRPGEEVPYPVQTVHDVITHTLKWNITSTDTAIDGDAQAQITLTKDEVINKSLIFDVTIEPSLEPEGPVPDPLEDWYARIMLAEENATIAAQEAADSAAEIEDLTVSVEELAYGETPTVVKSGGVEEPYNLQFGLPESPVKGVDYFTEQDIDSIFPETPENPETHFLNGNREWSEISGEHTQLTGLNDDPDNQHITAVEKAHFTDDHNPHSVTKAQVGLENVEDGAQINVIEKIKIDGADLTPDVDKRITLPNKEPAFEKNTAFNKNFGDEENTVCEGDDARLSDARTPLSHTHDDRYYTESEVDTLLDYKVDKVEGETLTPNKYTDEEKTKLTGIEALAEVNIIEGVKVDSVLLTPDVDRIVNVDLSGKVDKVDGKALSTNDYTNEEKALVASTSLKNAEQDKQIATIEENLRRVNTGEVSATATGERVIHLGKDVANAPLKVETEGLLLNAPQLVTNGDFSNGTTGWTVETGISITGGKLVYNESANLQRAYQNILVVGQKYIAIFTISDYIKGNLRIDFGSTTSSNYNANGIYSFIGTQATNTTFSMRSLSIAPATSTFNVDNVYIFNLSTLITSKQYSTLYSKTFDLMSDEQIKSQMDLWVANGTLPNELMGVDFNKRFTSVGKNLFDGDVEIGSINTDTGVNRADGTRARLIDYIKVKPSTAYISSSTNSLYELRGVVYYNNDKVRVGTTAASPVTFTTPSDCYYIRAIYRKTNDATITGEMLEIIKNALQLELGSVATTYVPFAKSEMYIQPNVKGYRLPNGVKDTIEYKNGKYYYVQRVKKYTLQASDIDSLITTYTNIDAVNVLKPIDSIAYNNYDDNVGAIYQECGNTTSIRGGSFDLLSNVGYIKLNSGLPKYFYCVTKGTYVDLAVAKTALTGTDIYYQLATPITTEITADGVLNGYENGTVYVENAMKDIAIYDSGFALTNTDYPISELETVVKIDSVTGLQTVYSPSMAVIAGDKLSFTHSSLANGDLVFITYKYDSPLMGNTNITYIDNKQVVLGTGTSAGKYFKITPTVVDGAIVWVATEV